jgi:hypothetical protein
MTRSMVSAVGLAALAWLSPITLGQIDLVCGAWVEEFESYTPGSGLHGQGGWKGWDNDPAWNAFVTIAEAHDSAQSVDIVGNADLVHEFCGCVFGKWIFTAWQYVPDDFVGESYFILLNTYADGGPYNWSTQIRFDSALSVVESEFEAAQLPLITGRWVEIRNEIDLDANVQDIYYDGQLLSSKSWTEGVSGGGALNIGAVDLFANGATSVYYDDLSLEADTDCVGDLDNDGQVGLADLNELLSNYGVTVGLCYTDGDLNFDGGVNLADLNCLLSYYGATCP